MYINHSQFRGFQGFADSKSDKKKAAKKKADQKKKDQQMKMLMLQTMNNNAKRNAATQQAKIRTIVPVTKIVQTAATDRLAIEERGLTDRTNIGETNLTDRTGIVAQAQTAIAQSGDDRKLGIVQSNDNRIVETTDIRESGATERADIAASRDIAIQGDRQSLAAIQVDRDLALREAQLQELEIRAGIAAETREQEIERQRALMEIEEEKAQLRFEREQQAREIGRDGALVAEDTIDEESDEFSSFSDEPTPFAAMMTKVNRNYGGPIDGAAIDGRPRPLMQSGHTGKFRHMKKKRQSICRANPNSPRCQLRRRRSDGVTTFADYEPAKRLAAIDKRIAASGRTSAYSVPDRLAPENYGRVAPKKPCCKSCASNKPCSGKRPQVMTGCGSIDSCSSAAAGMGIPVPTFTRAMFSTQPSICDMVIDETEWNRVPMRNLRPLTGSNFGAPMRVTKGCAASPSQALINSPCARRAAAKALAPALRPAPKVYVSRILRRVNPLLEW